MKNVETELNKLLPYLIGIRFIEGEPLLDVVLKEKWIIYDEPNIITTKGDEAYPYFMIKGKTNKHGLSYLLNFLDGVIKYNIEVENKNKLLKNTYDKIKKLFETASLSELQKLEIKLGEEGNDIELPKYPTPINDLNTDTVDEVENEMDIYHEEEVIQNTESEYDDNRELNEYGCYCDDTQACDKCMIKFD